MHRRRLIMLALAVTLSGCTLGGPGPAPLAEAAPLEGSSLSDWATLALGRLPALERCTRPNVEEALLCGSLEVPEDRSLPEGRTLSLDVVVVPAQGASPPEDAVFLFEGGPGGAVTKRAAGSVWAGPVRQRDIVLVDQRGTSGSSELDCDLGEGGSPRPGELRQMYPPDEVAACAAELSTRADLRRYTSVDHADDIEAVRQWLGYGALNLRGGSYGTRAMMVYALRYPQHTRTLFGIGVDSPVRSNLAERGYQTEIALVGVSGLCAADPGCAALTPALDRQVAELVARLGDGPRRFDIADPVDFDQRLVLDIGAQWLTEQLRLNLYFAFTTRALPWAVHQALENDDWEPVVQLAVLIERSFKAALATGVALTIQCSEAMNFDHAAALEQGSRTLFGNYRLEQQLQGCAVWPHQDVLPLGVENPEPQDAPALWLSGAFDPVTPPAYGDEAAALFPNSLHLVLREGQHGPFDLDNSWECVHQIWGQFLARGAVDGLDTTCTESMHRPPFITDGEAFRTYVAEVLAPSAL